VPVTVTEVALVAATVRVEELPAGMVVGLALMLTVGAGAPGGVTVTTVVAVVFPPAADAVAVYVVVAVGLTDWVPPLAWRV
jgi:hypothetical protein